MHAAVHILNHNVLRAIPTQGIHLRCGAHAREHPQAAQPRDIMSIANTVNAQAVLAAQTTLAVSPVYPRLQLHTKERLSQGVHEWPLPLGEQPLKGKANISGGYLLVLRIFMPSSVAEG